MAAVAVAVAAVGPIPRAVAQQSLIESDPAVVRARADLADAQAAAHQAYAKLEATQEQQDDVAAHIADDEARVAAIEAQRQQLAAQRDALESLVKARAVAVYTASGNGDDIPTFDMGAAAAQARRQQFGEIAAKKDRANIKQLNATSDQLAEAADGLRKEQADLEQQRTTLAALVSQLSAQQAVVDQRVAAANAALERARVIGALHAANDPVMGASVLTAAQIVGWFNSKGYRPNLANTTVADLVPIFLQEAADEGVRGDVAFAQAVIETGGFSSAPDNNYSGLGWCDTCARGTRFPTPRDGIRAQVQLLLNYADSGSRAAGLHHPPSPYWWSADPARAARQFDTFFAKGWAPTWRDMGHGNWATDPNYSAKVINVYNQMFSYAQSH
jgi:hypothetical protein